MTPTLIRLALAGLLVGSLGIRADSIRARDAVVAGFDMRAAIVGLVQDRQLALEPNPARPGSVLAEAVYFRAAGCPARSVAMPLPLNVDALSMMRRLTGPGHVHRFYYLDRTWRSQDRVTIFLTWLRHSALSLIDATPYLPIKKTLVVSSPPECPGDPGIDWRGLWRREPGKAMAAGAAARSEG